VVPVPWAEEWEAQDLATGQIGISWLPHGPWSRGKCGLKVLQYQAARLPVVANPVGMQSELIEPGVTGFLPKTPEQWVSAVRTLAGDPALRRRMGQLARQRLETGYSVAAWAPTFVSAVEGMVHTRSAGLPAAPPLAGASRAIPDPFFLRMRRARVITRSALAGLVDGEGHLD
jgi:hypothetical protein